MTRDRELIHVENRDGFTLATYRLPEFDAPEGHFCSGDDDADAQLCADIHSGRYDWFAVEVCASREGVELASDYLGGCCYSSAADFVTAGDYWPDMCAEAVTAARAVIGRLCAC